MRRVIKIYRNRCFRWPDGVTVPARTIDLLQIDSGNAHLVEAIRDDSLTKAFQAFSKEGRHGVFATVDGLPVGHGWITEPSPASRVVNSYARLAAGDCLIHYCFVAPAHRGKGIYAEMLHALTSWAFVSRARRVLVDTGKDNVASQHGILRAGFVEDHDTVDVVVARRLLWSRHRLIDAN